MLLENISLQSTHPKEWNSASVIRSHGRPIGYVKSFVDQPAARHVARMTGEENPEVRRITGIVIRPEYRGKGLGRLLYLKEMARYADSWFYNSQASAEAAKSLERMREEGLIDLVVQQRHGDDFGPHAKRITARGAALVQKKDLSEMLDLETSIYELLYISEMLLPSRKLATSQVDAIDKLTTRKLVKQEKIEDKFILRFFQILEGYMPNKERAVDKFIDRYYRIIREDTQSTEISISDIFDFVRRVGKQKEYNAVARVIGLIKRRNETPGKADIERIKELKIELELKLLDPVKRVLRGSSSDATHSGVSHPIQVWDRYSASRIKNVQNRWRLRQTMRQIRQMETV